jgi:hypothetical protein
MSVCLLLATCDRYAACGFSSLFLCICVSTSVQTVIAEKLTGFQLTKKFLYCMKTELSLPYINMKNKIEISRVLKPGKTDFNNFHMILTI